MTKIFQPHEQRVIEEREQLQDKLNKLDAFLLKGKPLFIDDKNWELLMDQYFHMSNYNVVLTQRISLF